MADMQNPVLKNVENGQIIELIKSPFTIGRALTSDYVIENKIVSRTHCSLTKTDEGWTLTDSSTNGTLVNDGHYRSDTSPILKHNDEISLGYEQYTYRFVTEIEKVPNCDVERLKFQEISGNIPTFNEVQSPDTPNSFDENGVSDEQLNILADNMLNAVEQLTNIQTYKPLENLNTEPDTSTTLPTVSEQNLEQPTTSKGKVTSNQLEHCPEVSEDTVNSPTHNTVTSEQSESYNVASHQSNLERNNLSDSVSTGNINDNITEQVKSKNDVMLEIETNSSMSTVIYSLPEELPPEILQPVNIEAQPYNMNIGTSKRGDLLAELVEAVVQRNSEDEAQPCSISMEQNREIETVQVNVSTIGLKPGDLLAESIEAVVQRSSRDEAQPHNTNVGSINISTSGPNIISKPRDLLAESIEAVVQQYSKDAAASTSVQGTGVGPSTLNTLPSMSTAFPVPRSISFASPLNANKKVKVMAVSSAMISHLKPIKGQALTAFTVGAGQRTPVVRGLTENEMQRILANQPGIPVVLNKFPISWSATSNRATNSTGPQSTSTKNQTVSANRINLKWPTSDSPRKTTTLEDIQKNINNFNIPVSTKEEMRRTFLNSEQRNALLQTLGNTLNNASEDRNTTSGQIESPSGITLLQTAENQASTGDAAGTSTNQNVPAIKCHDSQTPGTSTAADKLMADKKQTNQNQYEEMENELMCTICANLFIKAVTLGCSHSFCQYCIGEWKKKKTVCPICRNKIASTTRTLVLDNIIEKMVETASEEDKEDRKAALEERKKIVDAETAKKDQKSANKNSTRGANRRGRGGTRGNPRNNTENLAGNNNAFPPAVITIADSPSTTDSENSSNDSTDDSNFDYDDYYSDEWYNGRPGAYYGGYGSCYKCGERGHWANGCPYR